MAHPEVELSRITAGGSESDESAELNGDYETDLSQDHSERSCSKTAVQRIDDSIVWHYLTFETDLPRPSHVPSFNEDNRIPPQPDLKQYESPFEWSEGRKRFITWLSCVATTVTAFTAGSYTAGDSQMQAYWGVSHVAITVGVTTFTTGFAIAPMVLAPFSEINGRRPMFVITGIMFVILQLCCAVTRSYAGMLVARFFTGVFSSTFSTMVGGVVADIYHAEDRNTAMALFSGAALFGTGLGPLISCVIATHTTWRWIFYLQVITCGAVQIVVVLFFKETRGSVLLSQKAKKLNKYYDELEAAGVFGFDMPSTTESNKILSQRIRWKVKADEERASLASMIGISLYRPFHLLFTEPVVFFFSLWISFAWAVLYLTFGAIPLVFSTSHNFTLEQSGFVFAAISVTAIISTLIAIFGENAAKHHFPQISGSPEGRLYIACVLSALLPIGLFWFGKFSTCD